MFSTSLFVPFSVFILTAFPTITFNSSIIYAMIQLININHKTCMLRYVLLINKACKQISQRMGLLSISDFNRLAGYSLYISNSSITKTDGYLCYHHTGPGLPSNLDNVTCNHIGQYVIIYNERNETSFYNPPGYSNESMLELCEVEVYGVVLFISSLKAIHGCKYQISEEVNQRRTTSKMATK